MVHAALHIERMTTGVDTPDSATPDARDYADLPPRQRRSPEAPAVVWREITGSRPDPRLARHPRAAHLFSLTTALSVAATPTEVAEAVVREATSAFDAAGTVIARMTADGARLEMLNALDMPAEIFERWRFFSVDSVVPLADVARTGAPLFLESRDDWLAAYPNAAALLEGTNHHSHIVAPLVVEGRAIGSLGITFDHPRPFDESDRTLALAIAHQAAIALERARLFERERVARAEAEVARNAAEDARARADEANRAKTRFLTTMSHELRTPLNAIAGYADLLSLGIYGPVNDAQSEALARITRSQRHLLGLIDDVLSFARIEAGRVALDLQVVPVASVFADVEALVAPQAAAKGLEMAFECDAATAVRADPEKLRQILLNLVSNAVKFTPSAGTIALGAASIDGTTTIRVRDSGIGIAADQYDRAFEPFVQLGRDLDSQQGGTGLGLSISRDLARLMGGDLTFESALGVGTEFVLTLPSVSPTS